MLPSAIIFDLDGTLIESEADLRAAANHVLWEYGAAPLSPEEFRGMFGDGIAALVARALAARGCQTQDEGADIRRLLDYYGSHLTAATRPYPGVPETLETLRTRGLTLCLCTNKVARVTHLILERLALANYFTHVVAGDSVLWRKPDPRVLSEILGALSIGPEAAVMVGDSEVDSATASAAGTPFVLMTYGYHRGKVSEIPCLAALDRFDELPAILAKL